MFQHPTVSNLGKNVLISRDENKQRNQNKSNKLNKLKQGWKTQRGQPVLTTVIHR